MESRDLIMKVLDPSEVSSWGWLPWCASSTGRGEIPIAVALEDSFRRGKKVVIEWGRHSSRLFPGGTRLDEPIVRTRAYISRLDGPLTASEVAAAG